MNTAVISVMVSVAARIQRDLLLTVSSAECLSFITRICALSLFKNIVISSRETIYRNCEVKIYQSEHVHVYMTFLSGE